MKRLSMRKIREALRLSFEGFVDARDGAEFGDWSHNPA